TPQRDPAAGRIARWVGTCTDVDDSRKAEAANARLAAIVASTSDAVISFDPVDGRILTWNRGAEALFGYTADEAISRPVGLLVPPDMPEGNPTGVFRWAMEGRHVHEHETVRVAKGGERIPVSVTAARMLAPDGRAIGVSAIFRDLRPHREAEAALQRQTELLRTITDNVAEALFLMDAEGRVTFMNPAAERMLAWPREELLGRALHDAVHHHRPDGSPYPAADCPLVQVFSTGRVLQAHEDTFFRRDGAALQVACSNAPVVAKDGRVTGAVLVVHDIADRKAAEAALAESQARLRETLATLDLGTAMTRDFDGRIRYWSSGCARLYGWTAEEAVGRNAHELLRTAFPATLADIHAALERDGEWTGDLRHRTRDGRELVVSARKVLRRGPDGRPAAVLEALEDVTAHRAAEAALARSEARLRAALDAIPQMVWSTRPDGHHDYYNRRWYEFTGATPTQTEGENWNPQFHPEDQERAWARWRHSLETGEPYEIEYRLRAADGSYRWTLGRALPVRDPDTGRITRWYGTCTEIDELVTTRAALAEALEVKEALLHEVNHRVKNSLQLVSSLLTLQASRARDAGLRAALGEARARIGVVARLHQRLYQMGTHGRVELVGFLRELCEDTAAAVGADEGARVRLAFEPPADGRELLLPIDRAVPLALIVSELLTNAVKYAFPPGQEGGTVRVAVEPAGGGAFAALIEDDGAGLPEGFDPAASHGVGMRLVSTLARQLAAELRVGPGASGVGAAFELRVPKPG
ncbi:MAG: PAS domain S-box protein, partial [Acetobacteraceae bacterium]|nr:PAS domain S-box protein [Acetobacteraceae bacterium]